MIEIELRFKIANEPDLNNLIFKKDKIQKDVYFDTPDYKMFLGGNFMRTRNDKRIDFKLDIGDTEHNYCQETSFDVADINGKNINFTNVFKELGIDINTNFTNFDGFISVNNFIIFCPIVKQRKVYTTSKSNIIISIDKVENLGFFLEAEVTIDDNDLSDKNAIVADIKKFLVDNKLICPKDVEQKIGYVELYLMEHNPKAYKLGKFKA